MTNLPLNNDFNTHRKNLIFYARGWKIPYEDIEEIVNDTILKALENFDNERGNFESYCRFILKNQIINFKKSNKDLFLLITIDDKEDILPSDTILFEEIENNILARKFLEQLKNELLDDELILFEEIYRNCEKMEDVNISKASREVSLDPRGWDIFRRIQRKANKIYKNSISRGVGFEFIPEYRFDADQDIQFQLDVRHVPTYGYEKFLSHLNEIQLDKLRKLYN